MLNRLYALWQVWRSKIPFDPEMLKSQWVALTFGETANAERAGLPPSRFDGSELKQK